MPGPDVDEYTELDVRILVRPRDERLIDADRIGALPLYEREYLNEEQLVAAYGADREDLELVVRFAEENELAVTATSELTRTVDLRGPPDRMARAFGVELDVEEMDGQRYVFPTIPPVVPGELRRVVRAIAGFDTRPGWRRPQPFKPLPLPEVVLTVPQVAASYGFPEGATGKGQRIAIISLDGGWLVNQMPAYEQHLRADLTMYLNRVLPGVPLPNVSVRSGDGRYTEEWPGSETTLDVQVAASAAPDAEIVVYVAWSRDANMATAISKALEDAVHDHMPTVISISHCQYEKDIPGAKGIEPAALAQIEATFALAIVQPVTVCVATGDWGSAGANPSPDGKAHVLYPATSTYVLACGGTYINLDQNGARKSEVVWNQAAPQLASSGGLSEIFAPPPAWQQPPAVILPAPLNAGQQPGRGVPDVAAHVGPYDGVWNGKVAPDRGTSAAAPLWAGLVACMNEKLKVSCSYFTPLLYAKFAAGTLGTAFNDVTVGDNSYAGLPGYPAAAGWDPCTGFGSPNGAELLKALGGP